MLDSSTIMIWQIESIVRQKVLWAVGFSKAFNMKSLHKASKMQLHVTGQVEDAFCPHGAVLPVGAKNILMHHRGVFGDQKHAFGRKRPLLCSIHTSSSCQTQSQQAAFALASNCKRWQRSVKARQLVCSVFGALIWHFCSIFVQALSSGHVTNHCNPWLEPKRNAMNCAFCQRKLLWTHSFNFQIQFCNDVWWLQACQNCDFNNQHLTSRTAQTNEAEMLRDKHTRCNHDQLCVQSKKTCGRRWNCSDGKDLN